jgi:hypothetical protein
MAIFLVIPETYHKVCFLVESPRGYASRVIRKMIEDGILERREGSLLLRDRLAVVDAWRNERARARRRPMDAQDLPDSGARGGALAAGAVRGFAYTDAALGFTSDPRIGSAASVPGDIAAPRERDGCASAMRSPCLIEPHLSLTTTRSGKPPRTLAAPLRLVVGAN